MCVNYETKIIAPTHCLILICFGLEVSDIGGLDLVLLQKEVSPGVHVMAQWFMNLTSLQEDAGLIPDLTQWVEDPALP